MPTSWLHIVTLIHCVSLVLAARHSSKGSSSKAFELSALETNVFHHGRQVLKNVQSEAETSGRDEFVSYLAQSTLEKCKRDLPSSGQPGESQLAQSLKEVCNQTESLKIVSKLNKLMNNTLVAKWICGGLTATDYISQDHLRQCQDAGKLVLGGLTRTAEADGTGKSFATMQAYALKIAVIFVPLPPPLGVIIEKGANMALSKLAKDAEGQLEQLEKKMSASIQKSLSQELLRLGTAQARAADEQIQEMLTLDALLNDLISKSSTVAGADFASAMAKVTSFNRWAIIEHDLSTSTEVLRPPDHMEDLEERADFAGLMATHLEMYLLVLSQMHRNTRGSARSEDFENALTGKAQRMARLVLPDLVLQSTAKPSQPVSLEILGNSPLLSQFGDATCSTPAASARHAFCCGLRNDRHFSLEFLALCLWLPLLDQPDALAQPLRSRAHSSANSCRLLPDARREPQRLHQLSARQAACADHQVMEAIDQHMTQGTFFGQQEEIDFLCSEQSTETQMATSFSFSTDGLCLEYARLFQHNVVAVLTALQFGSPKEPYFSAIRRSTCRLAYRSSSIYSAPKDWKLFARIERRSNGSVCDHCHWAGSPGSCAYQPPVPRPPPTLPPGGYRGPR